jgi:cytochrome c oxidase assembly factor CtaG
VSFDRRDLLMLVIGRPDAVVVTVVVLVACCYGEAVRHLRRSGAPWPLRRTVSMLVGLALVLLLLGSGLAVHAGARLGVQAVPVLALAMPAPLLLTVGRPVLLVRLLSGSHPAAATSGWARALADPVNGLVVLLTLLTVLSATALLGLSLRGPTVEHAVGVTALAGGFLFFWPLLALDWTPENRAARDRFVLSLFACGVFLVVGAAAHRTARSREKAWPADLDLWSGDLGADRLWTLVVLGADGVLLVVVACWLGVMSRREHRDARGSVASR